MAAARAQVARLAARPGSAGRPPAVLIQGETGVGKGLLAQAIHHASRRREGPWVELNCAAIPETLVEAELFGVERGAFTDARQRRTGLLQAAHGGVLFLDEVGALALPVQAKLLTALEQRQVRRLGSTRGEPVDVWFVSATNEDLHAAVEDRRFRADLYHRLAAVTLRLPALRERGRDVLELAEHYLDRACADYGLAPRRLGGDAREALLHHRWPGNVRELANLMERVTLLTEADEITADLLGLPAPARRRRSPNPGVAADEREPLRAALERAGGNLSRAAAELGLPRNTLRYRLQRHGSPAPGASPAATSPPPVAEPEVPVSPAARGLRWERRWVAALQMRVAAPAAVAAFQLAPIIEGFAARLREFGAHLEALHPDGFVGLFGLEPMEDAPGRAVHAAWAIQKAGERAQPAMRLTGAVHVAECLIGRGGSAVGMDRADRRGLLDPVDALLVDPAAGSLLVTPDAAAFLERRFALVRRVQGEPPAYAITGRGGHADVGGRPWRSPLVGRDLELAALRELLARAEQGHGQVVELVGEAGVGKSRLVSEFCRAIGPAATIHEGRCLPYGGGSPYLPILDIIRQRFGLAEVEEPARTRDKVLATLAALQLDPDAVAPYVLHLLGAAERAEGPLAFLNPEAIKSRTVEALRRLCLAGAHRRPTVIVVEDLHWIDRTSEEALAALVGSVGASRLMLLATYRPGYRPPWPRSSHATQLGVSRLSDVASAAMVAALRAGAPLAPDVLAAVLARADGIPLFLEELTRALIDHPAGMGGFAIPRTLQDVLTARLDRLPGPDRDLVQAAAVLGDDVAAPVLRAMAGGLTPGDLESAMARLQAGEFLLETGVAPLPTYRFKHAILQEVAYGSLLPESRRALHAAAADILERLAPSVGVRAPEVLARHHTEAGLADRAVCLWHRAGWRAIERSASAEAIQHFEMGLRLLGALPEGTGRLAAELALRTTMSNALLMARGYGADEVEEHLLRASAICRELGDSASFLPVLFGLWRYYLARGRYRDGARLADDILQLASATADPRPTIAARAALGILAFYGGQLVDARRSLEHAVSAGDAAPEFDLNAYGQDPTVAALAYLAETVALTGDFGRARALAARGIELARTRRHAFTLAFALHAAALIHVLGGDVESAGRDAGEQIQVAEDHAFPFWKGSALLLLGWVTARRGDTEGGLAQLREGARLYRAAGVDVGYSIWASSMAWTLLDAGETEAALALVDDALRVCGQNGERVYAADLLAARAEALLRLDPQGIDGAIDLLMEGGRLAREQGAAVFEARISRRLLAASPDPDLRAALQGRLSELSSALPRGEPR